MKYLCSLHVVKFINVKVQILHKTWIEFTLFIFFMVTYASFNFVWLLISFFLVIGFFFMVICFKFHANKCIISWWHGTMKFTTYEA
jgi:hypothetical protein